MSAYLASIGSHPFLVRGPQGSPGCPTLAYIPSRARKERGVSSERDIPGVRAPGDSHARRSSLTLAPFLTSTMLIAAAHAGSTESNGVPSVTSTLSTSLRRSRSASAKGSALTSKPSLPCSDTVQDFLAIP